MLVIRQLQMQELSRRGQSEFFVRATQYLCRRYPQRRDIPELLHKVQDWATKFDLDSEAGIVTLAELAIHYGGSLLTDRTWRTILEHPNAGRSEKVRRLAEYIPEVESDVKRDFNA